MKSSWLLAPALFLVSLQSAPAKDVTETLQNGLNGYSGCDDSYLWDLCPTKNCGVEDKLAVEYAVDC